MNSGLPPEPDLNERFAALRDCDCESAPPFRRVLAAARIEADRRRAARRRVVAFGLSAATAALALFLVGQTRRNPAPEPLSSALPVLLPADPGENGIFPDLLFADLDSPYPTDHLLPFHLRFRL